MKTSDFKRIKEIIKNSNALEFKKEAILLVKAGDQRSLMCLVDAACSEDPECGNIAVEHLLYTGVKGLKLLFSNFDVRTYEQRCNVYSRLEKRREICTNILFSLLDSPDESTFYWAFDALNRLNPLEYKEHLRSKLYSSDKFKRVCAVKAAGKIKAEELVDDIVNLLSDPYGSVQQEAFIALAGMGKRVIQRILSIFGDLGLHEGFLSENYQEKERETRLKKLIESISGIESSLPFFTLAQGVSCRRNNIIIDHLEKEKGLLFDYYLACKKSINNQFSRDELFDFLRDRQDDFYLEKAEHTPAETLSVFIPFLIAINSLASSRALAKIFARDKVSSFHKFKCLKELSKRGAAGSVIKQVWKIVKDFSAFEKTPLTANIKNENEVKLLEICLISLNGSVGFNERDLILPFFRHSDFRIRSSSRIALEV